MPEYMVSGVIPFTVHVDGINKEDAKQQVFALGEMELINDADAIEIVDVDES